MKNLKLTNIYQQAIRIILIATFVFSAGPISSLAYFDSSYDYPDYSYDYPDYSYDYQDYSYDYPDYSYDYQDYSYDYSNTSYNVASYYAQPNYTDSSNYYMQSGGYYSNPNNYYRQPSGQTYAQSTYTLPSYYYTLPSYYTQTAYYDTQPATYYPASTYSYAQPTLTNQVLSYTDTNPTLDSVYLSDIPSTGFEDYYGIIIFISSLLVWSGLLSYIIIKKKNESQPEEITTEVNSETGYTQNHVSTHLLNNIDSDNSDVNKVGEYARMNKILLSSDASTKLVKLSRLGKINVSEYIKSIATGEWLAVGEKQIKIA